MFLESRGSNVNLSLVSEILGDIVIFYKRQLGTFAQVSKWYLVTYLHKMQLLKYISTKQYLIN